MTLNTAQVRGWFVQLFVLLLYVAIYSYDHGGTVSSPKHFFLGKLEQAVTLSLVNDE